MNENKFCKICHEKLNKYDGAFFCNRSYANKIDDMQYCEYWESYNNDKYNWDLYIQYIIDGISLRIFYNALDKIVISDLNNIDKPLFEVDKNYINLNDLKSSIAKIKKLMVFK